MIVALIITLAAVGALLCVAARCLDFVSFAAAILLLVFLVPAELISIGMGA